MPSFAAADRIDSHATASLRVAALTSNPIVEMSEDSRRQPMQPPVLISGHIPTDFYRLGSPSEDQVAAPEGAVQDQWVFSEE